MRALGAVIQSRTLQHSLMAEVTRALAEDLGAETLSYCHELYASGWVTRGAPSGPATAQCLEAGQLAVRQAPAAGFALYNPLLVQPDQRNVLLGVAAYQRLRKNASEATKAFLQAAQGNNGLMEMSHMRVVLAEGPIMLSWVGAWREEPFSPAEEHRFGELIPALASQFRLENKLGLGEITKLDAMFACLAEVDNPVFVLNNHGRALFANDIAASLVDRDLGLLRELREHVSGGRPSVRVKGTTAIQAEGGVYQVVLLGLETRHVMHRVREARRRWMLTAGEAAVLLHLVDGAANKDIAAKLGCSPRTVEVHVGAILRKTVQTSRAELIAAVWKDC
jgi:DNA-binding CsgD family transcriptional regulator